MFFNKRYLFVFAAIVVAVGLYCFNPFALYFQNDDFIHIPLSAEGKLFQHNSFRPVCDLSVMLDYFLWHKNAFGYHLTNLLLHIIDTFLVFIFCKNLFKKYSLFQDFFEPAFLTALLFFVYAMHSEAIFWILGRSATLGVLFFLLSLIFYLKRAEKKYFLLSILFALIAWLTYESTWILTVIFLVISFADYRMKSSSLKKEMRVFSIVILLFVIYLFARSLVIHEVVGEYEASGFLHLNMHVLLNNYLKLMMRSWLPALQNSFLLIGLFAAVILLLFFSFFKIKNQRIFFIAVIVLWLISLVPFASLGIDTKGTESERFLYLSSIFVCILIMFLSSKISNSFLKNGMLGVLFTVQIFFLFCNMRSYRFAGNIVKTTIEQINHIPAKKNLYINDLPQQNHGALIFRVGFFEAVKWMKNAGTFDSAYIVSQQAGEQRFCNDYKVQRIDSFPQMPVNSALQEHANNSNEYKRINFPYRQITKDDAYFNFTDSSLNVSY